MSTFSRLDDLYKTCIRLTLDPPIVAIADTHLGDGSKADNFCPHRFAFERAIEKYQTGWKVVTLGDIYDKWQFGIPAILKAGYSQDLLNFLNGAELKVPGNHDWELLDGKPEAVLLTVGKQEIFLAHGHQNDRFSDQWRGIGRFFVRHLWLPLERLGLKEPQLPGERHAAQMVDLIDWANTRKVPSIFGHIHSACQVGYATICESPITGRMRFVEITDRITIV